MKGAALLAIIQCKQLKMSSIFVLTTACMALVLCISFGTTNMGSAVNNYQKVALLPKSH